MKTCVLLSLFVALNLLAATNTILLKDIDWCNSPYCKVKANHTICKWGLKCAPEKRCETHIDFNKEMKDYIMELHNEKRNYIALGKEDRVPENLRQASDMKVIQWDIQLEFVARCHSRQCIFKHDDCRAVPRFDKVGQNIYTKSVTNKHVDVEKIIKDGVDAWYNEIEDAPEEIYTHWTSTEKPTGHYTQLIWAKTGFIGCGLSQLQKSEKSIQYFLVCNYGGSGNIRGSPIYSTGEPCSNCLNGKQCNSKYHGLCGTIEEYPLRCPCEGET